MFFLGYCKSKATLPSTFLTVKRPRIELTKSQKRNDHWYESYGSRLQKVISATCVAAVVAFAEPSFAIVQPPQTELFEPMRYLGRWYEVASLKKGFAGEGQQDCHCTQGVYIPKNTPEGDIKLEVNTFCFHGGPRGRLSGIRGDVSCANPRDLSLLPEFETKLEREEKIEEKCILRFPQIPFIPPEPYDVIRTDYKTYAIVQGATDRSFVQIYSRTPNPGRAFIEEQKKFLARYEYPIDQIQDTPQDCPVIAEEKLMSMMNTRMMDAVLTNTEPEAEVESGVRFEGSRDIFQSVKDILGILNQ